MALNLDDVRLRDMRDMEKGFGVRLASLQRLAKLNAMGKATEDDLTTDILCATVFLQMRSTNPQTTTEDVLNLTMAQLNEMAEVIKEEVEDNDVSDPFSEKESTNSA